MISKYPGTCKGCGKRFDVGANIRWEKGQGVVSCPACAGTARASNGGGSSSNGGGSAPAPRPAKVGPGLVVPAEVDAATRAALLIIPERPSWLKLDDHQEAVVSWRKGTALVAAGAGSGKSTVLIERTAALITEGCLPESVVVLAYNRKAADEMKARLSERLGEGAASRVGAFTFHGWAQRLLRRWDVPGANRVLGADEDAPSPYPLANGVLKEMGVNGEVDGYLAASGFIREALIDLDAPDATDEIAKLAVAGGSLRLAEELLDFSKRYQKVKQERQVIDFADMLYLVGREIQAETTRANDLATYYRHVMVDEAQDANVARNVIGWHLGTGGADSFVSVGDLRQSIYGFTGARPDLFKGLLDRGAKLLTLPVNRRSTAAVVEAGNFVAEGRDWNLGGACAPRSDAPAGEPVRKFAAPSPSEEAALIADDILAHRAELPLADEKGKSNYAVLTRTNAAAADLEVALTARCLPVRVLGSTGGVWATNAGRHVLAYLAGAEGKAESGLTAVANRPLRYLKGEVVKAAAEQAKHGRSLIEALRATYDRGAGRLAATLSDLAQRDWKDRCAAVADLLKQDLEERAAEAGDVAGRAVNPDEDKVRTYEALASAAEQLGSLEAIYRQIEEARKVSATAPAVEIATCHKSKGLEWTTVYVANVTAEVFPHAKAEDIEEERRLFYVAITRAKVRSVVSCSGEPSEFWEELPESEGGPGGGGGEKPEPAPLLSDEQPHEANLASLDAQAVQAAVMMNAAVAKAEAEGATIVNKGSGDVGIIPASDDADDEPQPSSSVSVTVESIFGEKEWHAACDFAYKATLATPAPTDGTRYVQPTVGEFHEVLDCLGFEETADTHQIVFERVVPNPPELPGSFLIKVYTTIPTASEAAREVGEDSIKVAAVWLDHENEAIRPLHKRLPYACRTRGWRSTVLDKVAVVAGLIMEAKAVPCKKCGAPTLEREGKHGTFRGCLRYPKCNGR